MLQLPPDAEHATSERREDTIPATLATLLLQYLSTLALPSAPRLGTMTPAAPQDDLLRQVDTRAQHQSIAYLGRAAPPGPRRAGRHPACA